MSEHSLDDPVALREMMLDYVADLMREHENTVTVLKAA